MSRPAALAALLLGGCASAYAPPPVVEAVYRCDGGVVLPARFDNRAGVVELTLPSGAVARLAQQRAASGIWYAAAGHELRGKGREATITLPGAAPLTCFSLAGPG